MEPKLKDKSGAQPGRSSGLKPPLFSQTVGRSMKSSACIGRLIGLYFDHKEIRIKEVPQ